MMKARSSFVVALMVLLFDWTNDSVLAVIEEIGGSNDACRPGSTLFNAIEENHCIYVGTATTWSKARDVCRRKNAILYNHNKGYTSQPGRPLSDYLISNGITQTWAGLYVRDGKLNMDILDPPGVQTGQGTYNWDTDQPTDDKECGSATVGYEEPKGNPNGPNFEETGSGAAAAIAFPNPTPSGKLPAPEKKENASEAVEGKGGRQKRGVPGLDRPMFGSRLSLTDCDKELPFVCVAKPLTVVPLGTISICKNGTIGSEKLNRCYSLSEKGSTHEEAVALCENEGGKLARASSPFYRKIIQNAMMMFRRRMAAPNDQPPSLSGMWVDAGVRCNIIDDSMSDRPYHWDCNAKMHYLCQTPAVYDDNLQIKVTATKVKSVKPLATSGDLEVFILSDDVYLPNDLAPSLLCKVKGYNRSLHQVAWYRNGEVFQPWTYRIINDEIYLNLTSRLMNRGDKIVMVGYYWCEVTTFKGSLRSNSVFVRYEDKELHAGSIETEERARDVLPNYSLFNLVGFTSDVIQAAISSYQYIEVGQFPAFIRPLRFRNNGSIMDFMAYRDQVSTRGFQPEDLLQRTRDELKMGFGAEDDLRYFRPETLQVRSIDYCLAYTHIYKKTKQQFNITQTVVGATFYTSAVCGVDKQPMAEMECRGNKLYGAYWGKFIFNDACDFSDISETGVSNSLKNLSEVEVTKENVQDLLESVKTITKETTLNELDLLYTATILENAASVSIMSPEVAEDIYTVYNAVLESSDEALKESQERGKVTNRVLNTMDAVAERLEQQPTGYQRIVTDSFGTEVWDLTNSAVTDLVIGLQFSESGYQPILKNESMVSIFTKTSLRYSDTVAAIIFPKDFVQQLVNDAKGKNIRLSMHIYKNTKLFSMSENSTGQPAEFVINSKVIAAKILVDGQPITDMKGAQVTTVFQPNTLIREDVRRNLSACGYWNFTGNDDSGTWSTDGCRYDRKEEGRDVCVCDHLTNFAVLLDFYGQSTLATEHALPLSILTIIGLSLSIIGLTLTILSFLTFKKLRQTRPQQTLFNLALAELCSWVVFLAGINQTQDYVGCIVVAAMLHYFIMASFMWMLMEALLHYLMFVKVLGTYFNKYMLKTTIPAWGFPILPVIVVLSIDTNLYRGGDSYCWMSLTPFYYAFALPVGLIILSNIVIYIMVVVSICRRSKATCQSSQSERSRSLVNLRAAFFCFVLLGLSWVFGYLTLSNARIAFQYIFTITTSIQGFLIFILFTLRDKKVRDSWRALCCKRKKEEPSSGRVHTDNLPLNKSNSNDSRDSNRTNVTGISSVPYYTGYEQQFDDFRRIR